jgi:hypothetical protein
MSWHYFHFHLCIDCIALRLSLSLYVCTYVTVGETSNRQNVNSTPGDDISSQGGLSVSLSLDPPKYVLVGGWVESGGGD